jgi:hypothetical protein
MYMYATGGYTYSKYIPIFQTAYNYQYTYILFSICSPVQTVQGSIDIDSSGSFSVNSLLWLDPVSSIVESCGALGLLWGGGQRLGGATWKANCASSLPVFYLQV